MSTSAKTRHLIVATFLCSWGLRLVIAVAVGCLHNFDRREMERMALGFLSTGTICNMMVPGLPSAGESPGYVLILAAIFKAFGDTFAGEFVKVVTSTAASSLRNALTVWLAVRLKLPMVTVIITAVLSTLWIGAFNTEVQGDWDPPYTACALILLAWFTYDIPFEERSNRSAIRLGAIWAFCSYLNFCILAVLGGFLVRSLVRSRNQHFARAVRLCIVTGLGVLLALAPWAIRNRITMGDWVLTRSMLGYGLSLSYHDGATALEPVNNHPGMLLPGHPPSSLTSPYPFLNPALRPELVRLGEIGWDRAMRRKGLHWMSAHPVQTASLLVQHTYYYWLPPPPGPYDESYGRTVWFHSIAKWLLTLLAIFGWIRLRRTTPGAANVTGIVALWFPLIYYVVNWSSRYRMPMEWVLVMLAAAGLAEFYEAALFRSFASTISAKIRSSVYS